MIDVKTLADAYQPLFDFMSREYKLTLVKSEMDDIISAVDEVNENLTELFRIKCDVLGCDETSTNQGMHWRESGYWCLCSKHAALDREGKEKPTMKDESIRREDVRKQDPQGYLTHYQKQHDSF